MPTKTSNTAKEFAFTTQDFDRVRALIYKRAGISLAEYGLARLFEEAQVQSARDWRRAKFGPVDAPDERIGIKRRIRRLLGV